MRFNGNNAGYDEVCFVLCDWSDGLRGVAAMVEETKLVRIHKKVPFEEVLERVVYASDNVDQEDTYLMETLLFVEVELEALHEEGHRLNETLLDLEAVEILGLTMTYKVCYQLTDDPNSTMRRDKVSGPFESREMAEHFLVNLAVNPEFIYGIVEEGDV